MFTFDLELFLSRCSRFQVLSSPSPCGNRYVLACPVDFDLSECQEVGRMQIKGDSVSQAFPESQIMEAAVHYL